MGHSFGIKCNECDYTKSFRMGIGMMYSPYALIDFDSEFALLPYLIPSKKTHQLVRNLIENKNGSFADGYEHSIYRCSKCGEFYGRFFFHIDHDDGSFEPAYKCTKCKKTLDLFELPQHGQADLSLYPCPQCGKKSLAEDYSSMLLWD